MLTASVHRRLLPSLWCALALAACKDLPRDPVVACDAGGSCPAGMACSSDHTCWTPPVLPPQQLAAPGGLVGEVGPDSITLSWAPVPEAVQYEVTEGNQYGPKFAGGDTRFTYAIPFERFNALSLTFSVRALATAARTASAQTAITVVAPAQLSPPDITVAATTNGVRVEWGGRRESLWYSLERADAAAGPYAEVLCDGITCTYSNSPAGLPGFEDRSGADDTTYWYRIACAYNNGAAPVKAVSAAAAARTPPAPPPAPVVRAKATGYDVLISWDPSPGADAYEVAADCGQSTQPARFDTTGTSVSQTGLPAGTTCHYAVTPYRGLRAGRTPGLATATVLMPVPGYCEAHPAQGGAAVALGIWSGPYTVNVFRRDDLQPAPVSIARGVASGTAFLDGSTAPDRAYSYALTLSNEAGETALSPWSGAVRWLGDLDLVNAGPQDGFLIDITSTWGAGQSFTAGKDGLLSAIEIADLSGDRLNVGVFSGGVRLGAAVAIGRDLGATGPFAAGTSGGGLAIFDPPVRVSRGDALWFEVWGMGYNGGVLGLTGDAYPDGALLGWPAKDLAFKTFLRPAPDGPMPAPLAPVVTSGNAAFGLEWNRPPGAVSFTVLRGNGGAPPATPIATTTQTTYVDRATGGSWYSYAIQATDGSGATATSPAAAQVPRTFSAVSLRGTPDPSGKVLTLDGDQGQVITIDRTGRLKYLELSLGSSEPLGTVGMGPGGYYSLTNAAGEVVARDSLYTTIPPGGAPPALDPEFFRGSVGIVDLYTGGAIPVTQGQVLTLNLRFGSPIVAADGPSAEGGELVHGVAVPGRTLLYKLVYE